MNEYADLLARLQSLMGGDSSDDNIYKQASNAIERLLARHQGCSTRLARQEDPSDHEAEGAMRYVMSRNSRRMPFIRPSERYSRSADEARDTLGK